MTLRQLPWRQTDMHEPLREFRSKSAGSDRSFGLVMAGVSFVLGSLPLLRGHQPRPIWLAIGGLFLVAALIVPRFLGPLNLLWFRFSLLVSKVMTPIVMGVLFFGVVTPISLMGRLSGKTFLPLAPDASKSSYWTPRDDFDVTSAKRLF